MSMGTDSDTISANSIEDELLISYDADSQTWKCLPEIVQKLAYSSISGSHDCRSDLGSEARPCRTVRE